MEPDDAERTRRYEIYNLLYWIKSSAPESDIARVAFDRAQMQDPPFKPREHPDLDKWIDHSVAIREEDYSPFKVAQLLSMSPDTVLERLHEYENVRSYMGPNWDGLMANFEKAVMTSFDWGMSIANLLASRNESINDVWQYIMKGCAGATLSEDQWNIILDFLKAHPQLPIDAAAISKLLEPSIKKTEGGLPFSMLSKAEEVIDQSWQLINAIPQEDIVGREWVDLAVNHPAGSTAEFWLQALHQRRKTPTEEWAGLPDAYKKRFAGIIADTRYPAQLARVMLAGNFHFLFYLDWKWAKETLLPLLDFNVDATRAAQAWNAFLYWGRIPPSLHPEFKVLLLKAIEMIEASRERHRERLYEQIVDIMLISAGKPLEDNWYYDVLRHKCTAIQDRVSMAKRIWLTLREAPDDFKKFQWQRWLKEYWSDRTDGTPVLLEGKEVEIFIKWVPHLKPIFEEAVDLACKMADFSIEHTFLFSDLLDKKFAEEHPDATLKLLVYVIEHGKPPAYHCAALVKLYQILRGQNITGIDQLLNLLLALPCNV